MSTQHFFLQNHDDFINTEQALFSHKCMAIDLEFYRRNTFASQLCLILVTNTCGTFVVDTMDATIKPIIRTLLQQLSTQHQLIFYSARQDLEIFDDICQQLPTDFIDIQYSGIYLDLNPQPSLGSLAEKLLKINKCNKTQTSDWRKRPLSEKQLSYAFAESEMIWSCHNKLKQQLTQSHWQAIQASSHKCLQAHLNSKDLVLKSEQIASKLNMNPTQQQCLLSLLKWRLTKAQRYDFPASWILSNHQIQELAKRPYQSQKMVSFNSKNQKYRPQIKTQIRIAMQQELNTLLNSYQSIPSKFPC